MDRDVLTTARYSVVAVLLVLVGWGIWWVSSYRPRLRLLHQHTLAIDEVRESNRIARLTIIEPGIEATEQAIAEAQGALEALATRVPEIDETSLPARRQVISDLAARFGVTVRGVSMGADEIEEPFVRHDIHLDISGRYHHLGAFLTELLSQPRLTQLRSAELNVPEMAAQLSRMQSRQNGEGLGDALQASSSAQGGANVQDASSAVLGKVTLSWFTFPESEHESDSPPNQSPERSRASR